MATNDFTKKNVLEVESTTIPICLPRHDLVTIHDVIIDYKNILNYCLSRNANLSFPDRHTIQEKPLAEKTEKALFDRKLQLSSVQKELERVLYPFLAYENKEV